MTDDKLAEAAWERIGRAIPHQDPGTRRYAVAPGCHDAFIAGYDAGSESLAEEVERLTKELANAKFALEGSHAMGFMEGHLAAKTALEAEVEAADRLAEAGEGLRGSCFCWAATYDEEGRDAGGYSRGTCVGCLFTAALDHFLSLRGKG